MRHQEHRDSYSMQHHTHTSFSKATLRIQNYTRVSIGRPGGQLPITNEEDIRSSKGQLKTPEGSTTSEDHHKNRTSRVSEIIRNQQHVSSVIKNM